MPRLESAALGVGWADGRVTKSRTSMGISHLLEHMAFKGTTRPASPASSSRRSRLSAAISTPTPVHETDGLYARVMKDDVPLALYVLSDILADRLVNAGELEPVERQVALQELGRRRIRRRVVFDHLQNELCNPDQPIGLPLFGTAKTVKKFDRGYIARLQRCRSIAGRTWWWRPSAPSSHAPSSRKSRRSSRRCRERRRSRQVAHVRPGRRARGAANLSRPI